jgi:hypothetical protein
MHQRNQRGCLAGLAGGVEDEITFGINLRFDFSEIETRQWVDGVDLADRWPAVEFLFSWADYLAKSALAGRRILYGSLVRVSVLNLQTTSLHRQMESDLRLCGACDLSFRHIGADMV